MSHLCLLTIPKPHLGTVERLQNNAFDSWRRLGDQVHVILLGDEPGVAESARDFGFGHVPKIQRNRFGTPIIGSAFKLARQSTAATQLLYTNADILFDRSLLSAAAAVDSWPQNRYLAIGQRIESDLETDIRQWPESKLCEWTQQQRQVRPRASILCKDYFLFPRHLFNTVPDFAVGRGNWDNWMVYHAHCQGIPVIDLTHQVAALHQAHDHQHSGNRRQAYVSGDEARENQRLAGGRHLLLGSHASHRLNEQGEVVPMGWRWISRGLGDAPRFVNLLRSLLRS
ncbi:MAG: hypothetical protein JNL67_06305 [Planctomycetaceae bacterium]|nr:hypothetical protein [Planctomycetaceae bacterium]